MTFGRVNASDRRSARDARASTSPMHHSQNANGLVCGLSTRKMRHALRDPELERRRAAPPTARATPSALEVERVDVLVFLGRVLGVLHRAVGPRAEPLGMLAHVRMVGRALEGDVERDLDAVLACCRDQADGNPRVSPAPDERSCGRPPSRRSPTGCRLARRGVERVVPALALGACRSDGSAASRARRSPSPRRTGSRSTTSLKRAVASIASRRAREQLVPAEKRALSGSTDHLEHVAFDRPLSGAGEGTSALHRRLVALLGASSLIAEDSSVCDAAARRSGNPPRDPAAASLRFRGRAAR